jgi:hypothetical protein
MLFPPCDAFFLAPRLREAGPAKRVTHGQKMIGFRQCRRSESKGNFVGFFRK